MYNETPYLNPKNIIDEVSSLSNLNAPAKSQFSQMSRGDGSGDFIGVNLIRHQRTFGNYYNDIGSSIS